LTSDELRAKARASIEAAFRELPAEVASPETARLSPAADPPNSGSLVRGIEPDEVAAEVNVMSIAQRAELPPALPAPEPPEVSVPGRGWKSYDPVPIDETVTDSFLESRAEGPNSFSVQREIPTFLPTQLAPQTGGPSARAQQPFRRRHTPR
jgi:hypothetical protein